MPERPTPYKLNPLPQAIIPQRSLDSIPSPEQPENLYKPNTKQQRLTRSLKPEAAPRPTSATRSIETKRLRRETLRSAQIPTLTQSQQEEAQEIAQRVQDSSQSNRLEHLLDRHQNKKRYNPSASYRQPLMELEHLAIAKRPDRRYQIVLRGTKQPVSQYAFETLEHCTEAAAELEHRFVLGPMLGTEVAEAVDGIVKAAVAREFVQRWCTVA